MVLQRPPEVILAAPTSSGRTYMPGLAALLGTGLTADCTGLDIEEGTGNLLQTRPAAIGGNIMATLKTPKHRPQMATVRPKTFSPLNEVYREHGEGEKGVHDAEIVIAGGMGLRRIENMAPIYKLARMINNIPLAYLW